MGSSRSKLWADKRYGWISIRVIEQAVAYMKEAGIAKSRFWAYLLVQDVEDAKNRAIALSRMGVEPFAQPYRDYNGGEPTRAQKQFAHWVNKKSVFHSCTWAMPLS